jgi:thiamine pyrophosphate-dependent acetolactate synthase large subunit-like protein
LSKWDYRSLAKAFGADGVTVKSMGELQRLFRRLPRLKRPTLVEVVVPMKDLPAQLARLAQAPGPTMKYRRKHRANVSAV